MKSYSNTTMPFMDRGQGICSMRGSCGKKSIFGADLPCPDDGPADPLTDPELQSLLSEVCGPAFPVPESICCTKEQLLTLRSSLQQAEPLVSSCPACRNNFRSFYCQFTCSPSQSEFLEIVSTQTTTSGKEAVKEVNYWVEEEFKKGFFESCKDVQFGATNGFAMDLIGGGAKTPGEFLKYMGDVRPGLGSPFQISFPETTKEEESLDSALGSYSSSLIPPEGITPLSVNPLNCYDQTLSARCTCIDCPSICPTLPYISPPSAPGQSVCTVGAVSCLTFSLLIIYGAGILFFLSTIGWKLSLKHRQRKYERVALLVDPPTSPNGLPGSGSGSINPFSHHSMTVAAAGTIGSEEPEVAENGRHVDFESSSGTRNGGGGHHSRGNGSSGDPDLIMDGSSGPSGSSRYRLGRGASLLDPIDHLQPRQNLINARLRVFFYRLGWNCAQRPAATFAIALVVIALLNVGWKWFEVETDPVRLWVAKGSESTKQKDVFDNNFGPFYRAEQVFVMGMPEGYSDRLEGEGDEGEEGEYRIERKAGELPPPTPVLSYDTLDWWLTKEQEISALVSEPNGYTLRDVCFAPAGPGTPCVVQSISAWMGDDMTDWGREGWEERLTNCAAAPAECLPAFGQPIDPKLVLGGANGQWMDAKSLVITYVVGDSLDKEVREKAEEWERTLRAYLGELERNSGDEAGVKVAYTTGVSLEEELNKSTNTDVKIVVASYMVMFLYISLTLGGGINSDFFFGENGIFLGLYDILIRIPVWLRIQKEPIGGAANQRPANVLAASPSRRRRYMASLLPTLLSVNSKFTLGLFGIIIVLVAVSSSVGLFSMLGVRVTLIIAEVIPFLVLAVGVDNVFILVHELDRQNSLHGPGISSSRPTPVHTNSSFPDSLDEEVEAPTHLPAEERVARALARMGPSILLSSVTEVVAFALGALVPMPAVRNFALYAAGSVLLGAILQVTVFVSAMALDLRRVESTRMDCFPCIQLKPPVGLYDVNPTAGEGMIARFIRKYYAPFLLRKGVKQLIIIAFGGLFITSIMGMQRITMGLDQRLALPSDSYLVDYFNALDAYLDVGPPVYFVAQGVDVASREGQQKMCGRFTTCLELSVAGSLEAERKRPDSSFISNPPAAWLDDFLHWTDPILETCCRVRKADPSLFCTPRDSERLCQPCFEGKNWDITMSGLPEGEDFMRYLQQWLSSPTDDECPLGGQAPYSTAVKLSSDNSSVVASHFRTFHAPLKSQADFINALAAARRISADIQSRTGVKVFPYSLFYVFFDQYAHIVSITTEVLLLALIAILIITSLLLGSWRTGSTVTLVCSLTVSTVIGIMGFWSISLNAISLVNLVISLGIAVEFCSHIARAFMGAGQGLPYDHPSGGKERDERAWAALVDVGPSVFSGITMTKLIGISVLALTRSKLLEVYYFRMWLSLIVSGALHGLVLLPVALSYLGGPGYSVEDSDEDWVTSAMRRPMDYEYAPFRDDDSVTSD